MAVNIKTIADIHAAIVSKYKAKTGVTLSDGTVIDDFIYAASDAIHETYLEIENARNPYLYSKISGSNIDDLGYMVNCPRESNEDDDTYLHRIIEWMISCESANENSIENALINLNYASHATYVPYTQGVGTASIYVIPNDYTSVTIERALSEVKEKISRVKSAASYIEYVIPIQKRVAVAIHIEYENNADQDNVLTIVNNKIKNYINSIPVGDYLETGAINKLGINEPMVSYFAVLQTYIDDVPTNDLKLLQTAFDKYTFDRLIY